MTGQSIGCLIGRFQKKCVETVFNRKCIALFYLGVGGSCVNIVNIVMGKGDHIIKFAIIQHYQCSQDLCDGSRVLFCMCILLKKHSSRICVHNDAGFSTDLHIRKIPCRVRFDGTKRHDEVTY